MVYMMVESREGHIFHPELRVWRRVREDGKLESARPYLSEGYYVSFRTHPTATASNQRMSPKNRYLRTIDQK